MYMFEKVTNVNIYLYYLKYLKKLKKNNIDLSFDPSYLDVLENALPIFSSVDVTQKELYYDFCSEELLDDLITSEFSPYFKNSSRFIFKTILNIKEVNPHAIFNEVTTNDLKITLKSYENLTDIIKFMHEALHVLIFKGDKTHVYSELFPKAFELIAAEYLDKVLSSSEYSTYIVKDHIDELRNDIYFMGLYPSLTPVYLPYIIACYNSVLLAKVARDNQKEFITMMNKIFESSITIREFLKYFDIDITMENISEVEKNMQIKLK